MSKLLNAFKKELGSNDKLGKLSRPMPAYKTGLDIFDYRNGKIDINGNPQLGIDGGKICTIVGASGVGKTALAIQMACGIADQYSDSQVVHLDIERATDPTRIMSITGWDLERYQEKYMHINENLTVESVYATIKTLADMKLEMKDELEYNTGMKDLDGEDAYRLQPTIVILDSIAMLAPEKIETEEEMSGQMSATAIARANTHLFKRLPGLLNDANIILIAINHITTKVEIGPVKTAADINFLKQNESLPGGKAPNYLANYLLRLDPGKKLVPDKELGIKGYYVRGTFIKSRSAEAGIEFTAVYEQAKGYSNTLTNYNLLKDSKLIVGGGRSFRLDGYDDVKFSQREVVKKYNEIPEFKEKFDEYTENILNQYIPRPEFLDIAMGVTFEDTDVLELVELEDGTEAYMHKETEELYHLDENGRYYPIEVEDEE